MKKKGKLCTIIIAASICFWDISLARNPVNAAFYVFHVRGHVTRVSYERYMSQKHIDAVIYYAQLYKFIHFILSKRKL